MNVRSHKDVACCSEIGTAGGECAGRDDACLCGVGTGGQGAQAEKRSKLRRNGLKNTAAMARYYVLSLRSTQRKGLGNVSPK